MVCGGAVDFEMSLPRNACEVRLFWSSSVSDTSGGRPVTKGLSRSLSVGGKASEQ